ncbi:hypothetical protein ABW16_12160 [Mycolicibacter heraklionensis]|uniref:Uncharacterized protein n=1 Tax=Mycolicibacter heraklionensis TaxID=512402 RepID=A0ABR5FEL3_9MYCO|nr:hypothetical protein ABW16_12160 [Mycolicibacter heraklionensis]
MTALVTVVDLRISGVTALVTVTTELIAPARLLAPYSSYLSIVDKHSYCLVEQSALLRSSQPAPEVTARLFPGSFKRSDKAAFDGF